MSIVRPLLSMISGSEYERDHLPRKAARSPRPTIARCPTNTSCQSLGRMKVAAVSQLTSMSSIARSPGNGRVRANRVVEVLGKAFQSAIRWGWRLEQPGATGCIVNAEEKRKPVSTT